MSEKKNIFIDGRAGTTGLRIYDRLRSREDVSLIVLSDEDRKNPDCRKQALNQCDIAFLCLPDDAAREAVAMVENPAVTVIDTSTAHRTDPAFAYGFPELSPAFEENVRTSRRIAVPGCHAGGFIALVYPLIEAGVLPKDARLTCHSLTGYSGGGKKMIEQYETCPGDELLTAPRQYGISQQHKHLKEMTAIPGLEHSPVFCPIVARFYSGMEMTVPLFASQLAEGASVEDVRRIYRRKYTGGIVSYVENGDEAGFLSAGALSRLDRMEIGVYGNDERILLTARYDNLGKGASGAAIECMNLSMGVERTVGLAL